MKLEGLDEWRAFFDGANASIFEVIDHAIRVAAKDYPEEFKNQRGVISEKLYSCCLIRSCCHFQNDRLEHRLNGNDGALEFSDGYKCKPENNRDDHDHAEVFRNQVSKHSYSEAEGLSAEIDVENETINEVLRIKEVLQNIQDESETLLFDSLRKLQLMDLSVEILQVTQVGKQVSALRKHKSRQIRQLSHRLAKGWKIMVDEWIDATETIREHSSDPNPSTIDEEVGLPSPPFDVAALFTTQTPIELSKFFDGMDDDGNSQDRIEIQKVNESGRKPLVETRKITKLKAKDVIEDDMSQPVKQESANKLLKPLVEAQPFNCDTGPWNPERQNLEGKNRTDIEGSNKLLYDNMVQLKVEAKTEKLADEGKQQHPENAKKQRMIQLTDSQESADRSVMPKSLSTDQKAVKLLDDAAMQTKLEASVRKLKEGYQQFEKARNQRTTQFMDLQNIPTSKQKLKHKLTQLKRKYHA